jgi:hypothetical protein
VTYITVIIKRDQLRNASTRIHQRYQRRNALPHTYQHRNASIHRHIKDINIATHQHAYIKDINTATHQYIKDINIATTSTSHASTHTYQGHQHRNASTHPPQRHQRRNASTRAHQRHQHPTTHIKDINFATRNIKAKEINIKHRIMRWRVEVLVC